MEKGRIKRGEEEARNIAKRFKNRDFSGNTGQAIKNSTWQIATSITAKVGSLIFTIILARMLMPELYGLYGLALSTILLIGSFSDLGLSSAVVTFLSKKIDKQKAKAKGYFYKLSKYKVLLLIITSLVILLFSGWISNTYYNKPIFYALLAGVIYLPMVSFSSWFGQIFQARNQFRPNFIKEIILQVSRLIILPIVTLFLLKNVTDSSIALLWIILALSICYLISGLFIFIKAKTRHPFGKEKEKRITKKEHKDLLKFVLPLTITALSGVFFGYIDTIMLGHFVDSSFIAYYQTAFNLIASASVIIGFAGTSMLPIFARLKKEKLDKAFSGGRSVTLLVSLGILILTFIFAPTIIKVVYGSSYLTATLYLRILSLLLVSFPLESLYQSYYTSQKRTKVISTALIISTFLNIILNYYFIKTGLSFGMGQAVVGACLATIVSRYFYLGALITFMKRKDIKKKKTKS